MQEMQIYGVSFDLVGKQPIVLLKTAEGNKFLPIWIGHPEAAAILMKLQSASTPRPMTHDLVTDMLDQLGAQVTRITVTELRENTFYAQITVQLDGSEIEVDSRPSDAIALAIRAEAPIFAADDVIEESAIEFEGEEVTEEEIESRVSEFKQFLDEVTPDEFASSRKRNSRCSRSSRPLQLDGLVAARQRDQPERIRHAGLDRIAQRRSAFVDDDDDVAAHVSHADDAELVAACSIAGRRRRDRSRWRAKSIGGSANRAVRDCSARARRAGQRGCGRRRA